MRSSLKAEQKFYDEHKKEYLQKYRGKNVLIYKNELRGVFDTGREALFYALDNGYKRNHFMVTSVDEEDEVAYIL